jgi:pimeloyl-ACP methyl ester carboxylesterase
VVSTQVAEYQHGEQAAADLLKSTRLEGFGLSLCADVGGDPGAPAVVLLPGAGQTRRAWRAAAKALVGEGYHVLSIDLRGHGESDWASDGDYSINAFVADLDLVTSSLTGPIVLVGASLSGIASLILAAEQPERIAGLVLVDVVPRMEPEGLGRIRAFMTGHADGFASVQEASDAVAAYLPHRPRPADTRGIERSLRRGSDGRWHWHWDPAFHASSAQRSKGGMFERMAACAAQIRIPTLLVSGRSSEVVGREGAHDLLRLIPHARWVDVEGASHMVAGDRNDAFIAALEPFLVATLGTPRDGNGRHTGQPRSGVDSDD